LELGKQEFEIISLNRKIIDVEVKITDLYAMMSDQEKLLTETKIDNSDIRDKIYKIQGHVQDVWPHDTEGDGRNNYGTEDAPNQSVLDWTVEDVYLWWRVALPRGAQRYIELVKECQLTGVDLLGVDEEMLSQFGMMKVLIHQVLKQIGHLKKIALNDNEYDGTKMARSKSKDRKADPSRDSRAYAEGTKDRGRSGDYGYEDERRARSNDRGRDRQASPRRSRDRRR